MHVDTRGTMWVYRITADENSIVIGVHENLGCEPTSVTHYDKRYSRNKTEVERPDTGSGPAPEGVRYFRFDY